MPARLARPMICLLVLLALLPGALAAQTPEATPAGRPAARPVATEAGWRIVDERELDIDTRYAALSPDGRWVAGVTHDDMFCVWDVATLSPECAGERLPIRAETIVWSPDGTAVAFALDAVRLLYDSDIYVYERETGELKNLTDDGVEDDLLDAGADTPIDDVPAWSPDSRRIAFARSTLGDEVAGSTTIMWVDRAGGEAINVLPLDVAEPMAVWSPMHWLPDGTLLYSQLPSDPSAPGAGVWTVDVNGGGNPLQILQGGETSDVPGPLVSDAVPGTALVCSYPLKMQFAFEADQPIFWAVDLASGERAPIQAPGDAWVLDGGFSPDGSSALLVTQAGDGPVLMVMDVASGTISPLGDVPQDDAFMPGAPQWATNDTVLIQRPTAVGPLLVTLAPAG